MKKSAMEQKLASTLNALSEVTNSNTIKAQVILETMVMLGMLPPVRYWVNKEEDFEGNKYENLMSSNSWDEEN